MGTASPPSSDAFAGHADRALLGGLLAEIDDGVALVDASGSIVSCNASAERILGLPAEQITGRAATDPRWGVVDEDGVTLPEEELPALKALRTGHAQERTVGVCRPNGDLAWVRTRARPVRDDADAVDRVVVCFTDITQRRRADELLRQQHDFTAAVLDTADALVIVVDPEGRIVRFNGACERLTGYREEEMVGRSLWTTLLAPEDREGVRQTFARLLARDLPNRHENHWVTRSGDRRLISFANTGLTGDDGQLTALIGTGIDVTEQRAAQTRLELLATRTRALTEIGAAHAVGSDAQLRHALRTATGSLGMETGVIARLDDGRSVVEHVAGPPGELDAGAQRELGETYCAITLDVDDVVTVDGRSGLESSIGVPLAVHGRPYGALAFSARSHREGPWETDDRDYVRLLGRWVERRLEQRLDAAQLREASARFSLAFGQAPIGMALTATDGRLLQVNEAFTRMLGRSIDDLHGRQVSELTHPEDRDADAALRAQLIAGELESARAEKRYLRADGQVIWGSLNLTLLRADDSSPRYFVSQIEDVTDRRQAQERLAHLALHDQLTGLPNRALLGDRIAHALSRTRRSGSVVGLLFVDLDRFKAVNDDLGHAVGDRLLIEIADRMRDVVRPSDTVARLGGDEFVVLCEDLHSPGEAVQVAERVIDVVGRPVHVDGHETGVGASIGINVVSADQPAQDAETLLRRADAALYVAKQGGRGRIEVSGTAPPG